MTPMHWFIKWRGVSLGSLLLFSAACASVAEVRPVSSERLPEILSTATHESFLGLTTGVDRGLAFKKKPFENSAP